MAQSNDKNFYFFAIGDMPYYQDDWERLDNLIGQLNSQDPMFTVHVGDIKKGGVGCTDEYFEKVKSYFSKFNHPLVYTPGDNEWTDCLGNDPLERLEKLRRIFYGEKLNLGRGEIAFKSEREEPDYSSYVENLIWQLDSIVFGTLHVVGSNNNLNVKDSSRLYEYSNRNQANLFWLDRIFDEAENANARGVVIMMQAAMNYLTKIQTGYTDIVKKLYQKAEAIDKPVLLVYGDAHKFMVDKPFKKKNGRVLENFTAVQVFGDRDMHAVKIEIDRDDPQLFIIHEEIVEKNR